MSKRITIEIFDANAQIIYRPDCRFTAESEKYYSGTRRKLNLCFLNAQIVLASKNGSFYHVMKPCLQKTCQESIMIYYLIFGHAKSY